MTTATLTVALDGGAPASGLIAATTGQSCQLGRAVTDGVRLVQYEIVSWPPDETVPAGWTDAGDRWIYAGENPPAFTLNYWGKYLFALRLNGASDDSPGLFDVETMVRIVSPIGLHDIARYEQNQAGGWVQEQQHDLRLLGGSISYELTTIVSESGATHTSALSERGSLLLCSNASGCSVTIPPYADDPIPIGTTLYFAATTTDQQITLVAGSGVTLLTNTTLLSRDHYSVIWAIKTATDTWLTGGDLQPL